MGMFTEVPIVMIEAAGAPVKEPSRMGDWKVPVIYVLEDGRRVEASSRWRLKREAVAEHAKMPFAPENDTAASFAEDGRLVGTRVTFHIGGRR